LPPTRGQESGFRLCRMFFSHDHPTRLITPKLSAMAMCKSLRINSDS
jgi:hypothetical protein